jgi:hypothetical protein
MFQRGVPDGDGGVPYTQGAAEEKGAEHGGR